MRPNARKTAEVMKKRLPPEASVPGGEAQWLCTFNDLMTLLMVFFVLLFSMSSITDPRIRHLPRALQSGLGILEAGEQVDIGITQPHRIFDNDSQAPPTTRAGEAVAPDEPSLKEIAEGIVERMNASEHLSPLSTGEKGEIRMDSGILFPVGAADINSVGYPLLDRIAEELRRFPHNIRVEGHTDDRPIRTTAFPSNWELSAQRAVNVVKYLVASGGIAPDRLSAVGYGAAKPCATNETTQGRKQNRRVEIILVEGNNHE